MHLFKTRGALPTTRSTFLLVEDPFSLYTVNKLISTILTMNEVICEVIPKPYPRYTGRGGSGPVNKADYILLNSCKLWRRNFQTPLLNGPNRWLTSPSLGRASLLYSVNFFQAHQAVGKSNVTLRPDPFPMITVRPLRNPKKKPKL